MSDDRAGQDASAAFLVFGPTAGALDLASADVSFTGEAAGDGARAAVAAAGDVDGDGLADVLIGAPSRAAAAGAAYVVLGGMLAP